jgi:type 1 fimbria pilin
MLKRMLATTAALALFALPLRAQAAAAGGGDQVTLTGQVIDVNCYSTHQLSGAQHKNCATPCANKGVSLAILTNDGTIYMPVSSKPADPQNSRLVSFAEGKVKVTGTHRMANGLHTIEIATVEAAS